MAAESGARQQLHELYRDHHAWLFNWLRRRLGCTHHAADVAHDTFERLLASRDALQGHRLPIEQPRAYLATTARRLLIDRARHSCCITSKGIPRSRWPRSWACRPR